MEKGGVHRCEVCQQIDFRNREASFRHCLLSDLYDDYKAYASQEESLASGYCGICFLICRTLRHYFNDKFQTEEMVVELYLRKRPGSLGSDRIVIIAATPEDIRDVTWFPDGSLYYHHNLDIISTELWIHDTFHRRAEAQCVFCGEHISRMAQVLSGSSLTHCLTTICE